MYLGCIFFCLSICQSILPPTYLFKETQQNVTDTQPDTHLKYNGEGYNVYWKETEEEHNDLPYAFLIQKLKDTPQIVITTEDKIYKIEPFGTSVIETKDGVISLGKFSTLSVKGKNSVTIFYCKNNQCKYLPYITSTTSITFIPLKTGTEPKIQRVYSATPGKYSFIVNLPQMRIKKTHIEVTLEKIEDSVKPKKEPESAPKERPRETDSAKKDYYAVMEELESTVSHPEEDKTETDTFYI